MAGANKKYDKIIVGLGNTGISCARFFSGISESVAIVDNRDNPPCLEMARNQFPALEIYLGPFSPDLLCTADELIVSPGVSIAEPAIHAAVNKGISVVGDIEIFCRQTSAPVIAITGSNGKSTVASLVNSMLVNAGRDTRLGGNFGTPALDLLKDKEPDVYVLELSSFQLETTNSLNPLASVILNITEDHMDRYTAMDSYVSAKKKIYTGSGVIVLNMDDVIASDVVTENRDVIRYSTRQPGENALGITVKEGREYIASGDRVIIPVNEIMLKGRHNLSNAMAALALGSVAGLSWEEMADTLRKFEGLPHRCQTVDSINGIDWINDSKATNVGACLAAIEGLGGKENLILIAGGLGKGADFSRLADTARGHVRAAILIGKDAGLVSKALQNVTDIFYAIDMEAAVKLAADISSKGDIVLLSPACASFDMFKDYQDRGTRFINAVQGLRQGT